MASIQDPAKADLAEISPLFLTNVNRILLVRRGTTTPTLATRQLALESLDCGSMPVPAGETISFQLIDTTGADANAGAKDDVLVNFYTNIGGRGQRAGVG